VAGDAGDVNGRLADVGLVQAIFGAFEAELGQIEVEDRVGALEDLSRGVGSFEVIFAHADLLCTLAGAEDVGFLGHLACILRWHGLSPIDSFTGETPVPPLTLSIPHSPTSGPRRRLRRSPRRRFEACRRARLRPARWGSRRRRWCRSGRWSREPSPGPCRAFPWPSR